MFAGIIKNIGTIESINDQTHGMVISCPLFSSEPIKLGQSIAIDGACLTVAKIIANNCLEFTLGVESLEKTLLPKKRLGTKVHVELSLRLGESIDGHFVQGHVDGLGELLEKIWQGESLIMNFGTEQALAPLIVLKGSIAINGVSLTVNNVQNNSFSICLIPHTLQNTCFLSYEVGQLVHIETDIIGRYVLKALSKPF